MTDYDGKDRPEHYELPDGDERTELRNGIVRALYALPMHTSHRPSTSKASRSMTYSQSIHCSAAPSRPRPSCC